MAYALLVGLGTVIFRNVTGWIKNSLSDGKIQDYEWSQLGITTIQVGGLFIASYYGLGCDEWMSAGLAFVGDKIILMIKQLAKKK